MGTSKAIIIGSIIIAGAIIFAPQIQALFATEARAEVAGMDSYDLRTDYDFKKAVERIVEDCHIYGEAEDGDIDAYISC